MRLPRYDQRIAKRWVAAAVNAISRAHDGEPGPVLRLGCGLAVGAEENIRLLKTNLEISLGPILANLRGWK